MLIRKLIIKIRRTSKLEEVLKNFPQPISLEIYENIKEIKNGDIISLQM